MRAACRRAVPPRHGSRRPGRRRLAARRVRAARGQRPGRCSASMSATATGSTWQLCRHRRGHGAAHRLRPGQRRLLRAAGAVHPLDRNCGRILCVWAGLFALLAVAGFLLKISADFSRIWFAGWFVAGFVALFRLRLALAGLVRRWARVGNAWSAAPSSSAAARRPNADPLRSRAEPYNDIRICGIFDDRDDRRSPPIVAGYPKLGTVAELIEFARIAPHRPADRVAAADRRDARALSCSRSCGCCRSISACRRIPTSCGSGRAPIPISAPCRCSTSSTSRSTTGTRSPSAPSTSSSACIGIVVFSPVMLADRHRHQARQQGTGALRRSATASTTRSSRSTNSARCMPTDRIRPAALSGHQERPARHPRRPLHPQDLARRTAAVLQRRCSGNLSLVGPRPHAVAAQAHNLLYDEVVDGYFARHRVKPGVTGWAQINGWRGEIDTDEKIRMPHRVRPLLHRELVAVLRSLDPAADADPAAQHGERLLSAVRRGAHEARRQRQAHRG